MRYSGLVLLVIGLFAGSSPTRGQSLPPLPLVVPHACLREYCCLGDWTTSASLPVRAAPGSRDLVDSISARSSFSAESTAVVVRRYGVAVVDTLIPANHGVGDDPAPQPGDTVYLARYEGEDIFLAYLHGRRIEVEAFWGRGGPGMGRPKGTPSYGHVLRDREEEWWVRVSRAGGRDGWINMTSATSVSGVEDCAD